MASTQTALLLLLALSCAGAVESQSPPSRRSPPKRPVSSGILSPPFPPLGRASFLGSTSSLSPQLYPPPPGLRVIQKNVWRMVGRNIIARRQQMENGWRPVITELVEPFKGSLRFTNYTANPVETAGLEEYESLDESVQVYFVANESTQNYAVQPQALMLQYDVISSRILEDTGISMQILQNWQIDLEPLSWRRQHPVVTAANGDALIASVRCRVLMSSRPLQDNATSLLPFTLDKRTAIQLALWQAAKAAKAPLFSVNVTGLSNATVTSAAPSPPRRLLQQAAEAPQPQMGADAAPVEVWLQALGVNFSAGSFFRNALATDGFADCLSGAGLRLAGYYTAGTTTLLTGNGTLVGVLHDPPAPGDLVLPPQINSTTDGGGGGAVDGATSDNSSGLSTGAIAGIAVAAVAAVLLPLGTLSAALLLCRRRRRQRATKAASTGTVSPQGGTDSADLSEMSSGEARAFESWRSDLVAKISGRPSHSSSGDGSDQAGAPLLDPAEIEICRDSEGTEVELGRGAHGRVFKGLRRGVQPCAVKKIETTNDPLILHQIRKEVALLQKVSFDKNVVQFYGACFIHDYSAMVVMELMEGGDLRKALSGPHSAGFRWFGAGRRIALDVARGLHFLHSSGVVHRDLKASNILLTGEGVAKVADVGLAKAMISSCYSWEGAIGTFAYIAPELLLGSKISLKADCFSFGVVLHEIVTGDIPVRGQLREVRVPQDCPAEIEALIADCVNVAVEARPSTTDIVARLLAVPPPQQQPAAQLSRQQQQQRRRQQQQQQQQHLAAHPAQQQPTAAAAAARADNAAALAAPAHSRSSAGRAANFKIDVSNSSSESEGALGRHSGGSSGSFAL